MSRPRRPTSSSPSDCSGGVFDWEPATPQARRAERQVRRPHPLGQSRPRPRRSCASATSSPTQVGAVKALGDASARTRSTSPNWPRWKATPASLEEAAKTLKALKERAGRAELEALLSGEADGNDAYVEINSGAGGTESADWALMLTRMYTRWANAHGPDGGRAGGDAGRDRRAEVRHPAGQGDQRLRLAEDRGRACTGWCASRPSTATRGATPASRRSGSIRWWTTPSSSRSTRPTCAPTPTARPAPAASTSTRPIRRCA